MSEPIQYLQKILSAAEEEWIDEFLMAFENHQIVRDIHPRMPAIRRATLYDAAGKCVKRFLFLPYGSKCRIVTDSNVIW